MEDEAKTKEQLNRKPRNLIVEDEMVIAADIEQVLRTGETQSFEYPLMVDGELRYWEARIVPSGKETVLAVARDIAERKRAEGARV